MTAPIQFNATHWEIEVIRRIVKRAQTFDANYDTFEAFMDIEACHCNGNPLDLEALFGADIENFTHDVFGIRKHIDRKTGQLMDCFVPRYSRQQ